MTSLKWFASQYICTVDLGINIILKFKSARIGYIGYRDQPFKMNDTIHSKVRPQN